MTLQHGLWTTWTESSCVTYPMEIVVVYFVRHWLFIKPRLRGSKAETSMRKLLENAVWKLLHVQEQAKLAAYYLQSQCNDLKTEIKTGDALAISKQVAVTHTDGIVLRITCVFSSFSLSVHTGRSSLKHALASGFNSQNKRVLWLCTNNAMSPSIQDN